MRRLREPIEAQHSGYSGENPTILWLVPRPDDTDNRHAERRLVSFVGVRVYVCVCVCVCVHVCQCVVLIVAICS